MMNILKPLMYKSVYDTMIERCRDIWDTHDTETGGYLYGLGNEIKSIINPPHSLQNAYKYQLKMDLDEVGSYINSGIKKDQQFIGYWHSHPGSGKKSLNPSTFIRRDHLGDVPNAYNIIKHLSEIKEAPFIRRKLEPYLYFYSPKVRLDPINAQLVLEEYGKEIILCLNDNPVDYFGKLSSQTKPITKVLIRDTHTTEYLYAVRVNYEGLMRVDLYRLETYESAKSEIVRNVLEPVDDLEVKSENGKTYS